MSEKIYACLLRLFPSAFREAYGEEALQLFRDRARDERGFFRTLRLWLDLLADLAISVPREYRRVRPALFGAAVQPRLAGAPSFFVLREESPGPGALLLGSAVSMVALSLFSVLLGHGNHRPLGASAGERWHAPDARPSAFSHPPRQTAHDREGATTGSTSAELPATEASRFRPLETRPIDSQSKALLPPDRSRFPEAQPREPRDSARPIVPTPAVNRKLNARERQRVVDGVIRNLVEHYVDRDVAQKAANALLAHEKNGDDDAAADGGIFADLLTKQIRDVSQDMHLEVVYSQNPLPDLLPEPSAEDLARFRKALEQDNCTFKKVEILPHNIGYLKFNAFPDASLCQGTARAAMASLNHTDAMIFDLRENRGGTSSMVSLIASYLFDHPEYLYDPRVSPTVHSWTLSPVRGNRLADKPVYVLTSGSTVSAAEQFCYDLKMLKRVTLVGETTHGSAHAGVFHRIDDHFGMGIPEARALNPYSKTDWEGTGVEPDVKVKAADALETAKKLAESKLEKK
jgi:hypothetical protein